MFHAIHAVIMKLYNHILNKQSNWQWIITRRCKNA